MNNNKVLIQQLLKQVQDTERENTDLHAENLRLRKSLLKYVGLYLSVNKKYLDLKTN